FLVKLCRRRRYLEQQGKIKERQPLLLEFVALQLRQMPVEKTCLKGDLAGVVPLHVKSLVHVVGDRIHDNGVDHKRIQHLVVVIAGCAIGHDELLCLDAVELQSVQVFALCYLSVADQVEQKTEHKGAV